MKNLSRKWSYFIGGIIIFFISGAWLVARNKQGEDLMGQIDAPLPAQEEPAKEVLSPTVQNSGQVLSSQSTTTQSSAKLTILETKKMTGSKSKAETGEEVEFSTKIKNTGVKKKFLTHLCFNHSGGVTFGCLLNKNLYPAEETEINNTMIFTSPGTYSIWLTWSQDKTNFYRPHQSSSAIIQVE